MASSGIPLPTATSSANLSPHGAELTALRLGSLDLIRTLDSAWSATSPVLFPIVGWARDGRIRVRTKSYLMGVHGFAASGDFDPSIIAHDRARFVLRDSATTRTQYPFAFELAVEYHLGEAELETTLVVANTGDEPMPYACGLHPGFRWPFAGGAPQDYRIVFDEPERATVPVIAPGGLFSSHTRPVPLDGRALPLSHDLLAQEALCFLGTASRGLVFERVGGPALRLELENFPHIAFWSRPPSPFLSIEAWTGHGDPVGYAGDLFDKPSMRVLAPGEKANHAMRVSITPAR